MPDADSTFPTPNTGRAGWFPRQQPQPLVAAGRFSYWTVTVPFIVAGWIVHW